MNVNDVVKEMHLTVFGGESGLEKVVAGGYVSDLLSDVRGFSEEGQLWITLQAHRNVVGVAGLKDLSAVLIVKGVTPDAETIEDSNRENIPLLGTSVGTFETAGHLFSILRSHQKR